MVSNLITLINCKLQFVMSRYLAIIGVNGVIFTSARLFATGANEGHLPSFFALFHATKQTPIPSLIFSCLLSLVMILFGNAFELVNYFSQALWLSIAACVFGLLWMRHTK